MANPLYNQLGGNNAGGNMMQAFQQFMQQNKGKDPNDMLNQIISSGRISQQQLDAVQQKASQMASMFNGMKSMFGF